MITAMNCDASFWKYPWWNGNTNAVKFLKIIAAVYSCVVFATLFHFDQAVTIKYSMHAFAILISLQGKEKIGYLIQFNAVTKSLKITNSHRLNWMADEAERKAHASG